MTRISKGRAAAVLGAAVLTLSSCASAPDTSAGGVATYACALAQDVDTSELEEGEDLSPEELIKPPSTLFTIAHLLGSTTSFSLDGYDSLREASRELQHDLSETKRVEKMEPSLATLRTACEEESLPVADVDVSTDGRGDFACTLVAELDGAEDDVGDWVRNGGEDAEGTPLINKGLGAASLLATIHVDLDESYREELEEASGTFYQGLNQVDDEQLTEGIDDVTNFCDTR